MVIYCEVKFVTRVYNKLSPILRVQNFKGSYRSLISLIRNGKAMIFLVYCFITDEVRRASGDFFGMRDYFSGWQPHWPIEERSADLGNG